MSQSRQSIGAQPTRLVRRTSQRDLADLEVITGFTINSLVPVFDKDVVAAPPAWCSRCICFLVFRLNIIDVTFIAASVCVEVCVFK